MSFNEGLTARHGQQLRMARESNDDEDAKETSFTLSVHNPVENFKGQKTELVQED